MRQNFTQLYVHLVWATWDRLPLITPDIREPLYNVMIYECQQMGCHVIAIGGIEDHVHLLVRFPATVAIASLVKQIKGSSSHSVEHQSKPDSFFKWQGSYAAFTVNSQDLNSVATYIQNQADHHHKQTHVLSWELP
ncbi:MAG: IS200/IS605 family transposase [Oculatellaceae cyanobacterium bins.114]|nr:IS200/IS605 family transposase [Oculatellaceae cyanobacterium bins.114]